MQLVQEMRRSLPDVKITATPYHPRVPVQQYNGRIPEWVRNISSKLSAGFQWQNKRPPSLIPQYNLGTMPAVVNTGLPQQPPVALHLMSCIHRSRNHAVLLQNELGSIGTDPVLFEFLKARIAQRRSRLRLALSCRSIQGVSFTKVSWYEEVASS